MPIRAAMSAMGRIVVTPVRRSIKAFIGPSRPAAAAAAAAVVASTDPAVVASLVP